jgi:type IV pilus assembly protein PilB
MNRHRVLPLYKRGTRLFVAIADPTNILALDEVKFHTGLGTEPILVEEAKLSQAIEKILEASDTTLQDLAHDEGLENLELLAEEDKGRGEEEGVNDTPIVRFVNKVLMDAINRGASDIHIEPYCTRSRPRRWRWPDVSVPVSRFFPGSTSPNGEFHKTVASRCASRGIAPLISA